MEDVVRGGTPSGRARGVVLAGDVALDERDVLFPGRKRLPICNRLEVAVVGRQAHGDDPLDELLGLAPVLDQVGDRHEREPMALAEGDETRDARHRPVLVHHLADDSGRGQPGESREVDRGLGLARPLQHPGAGTQREDVARMDEVVGRRRGIDGDLDRPCAVGGGDAGRDAVACLDRDGERRPVGRLVLIGHLTEAELVAALRRQAEADQPATVGGHEVHRVGRDELRGDGQVALVLAILVVHDDDEPAGPDLVDRVLIVANGLVSRSVVALTRPS